jgi:hypothetical protein
MTAIKAVEKNPINSIKALYHPIPRRLTRVIKTKGYITMY